MPGNSSQNMPITVVPYQGVGDYRFGLSPADVAQTCGAPSEENDILEMIFETRDGVELQYDKKGRKHVLAAITLLRKRHPVVLVKGVDVFAAMDAGGEALGSERLTGEKYSVFTQLGISVAGFGKKKPREGALLIAFSKASRALFELNGLKT